MSTFTSRPYIILAEYKLLSSLIYSPALIEDSRLYAELFLHTTAQTLFESLKEAYSNKIEINSKNIFEIANKRDLGITKENIDSIFSLTHEDNSSIEYSLKNLQEAKKQSNAIEKTQELITKFNDFGNQDKTEILGLLQDIQETITKDTTTEMQSFLDWTNVYIDDLRLRSLQISRYPYGDITLDSKIIKGAYPGAMTIIAGATSQGKSTYALNIINNRINQNLPTIYFTLEMSKIDTYDRLVCMREEIPTEDLYTTDTTTLKSIEAIVTRFKEDLDDNDLFYIVDTPMISIPEILAYVKEYKQRTKQDYVLVVIDLLTQVKEFMDIKGGFNLAQQMEKAMNQLNAACKELNIHIVGVVQFNRDADNFKIQSVQDIEICRPLLGNIKNANVIAERARVVLSLFRPKYYADRYLPNDEEAKLMNDVLEVSILKNSSGAPGRLLYSYFGETFQCIPLVEKSQVEEMQERLIDY